MYFLILIINLLFCFISQCLETITVSPEHIKSSLNHIEKPTFSSNKQKLKGYHHFQSEPIKETDEYKLYNPKKDLYVIVPSIFKDTKSQPFGGYVIYKNKNYGWKSFFPINWNKEKLAEEIKKILKDSSNRTVLKELNDLLKIYEINALGYTLIASCIKDKCYINTVYPNIEEVENDLKWFDIIPQDYVSSASPINIEEVDINEAIKNDDIETILEEGQEDKKLKSAIRNKKLEIVELLLYGKGLEVNLDVLKEGLNSQSRDIAKSLIIWLLRHNKNEILEKQKLNIESKFKGLLEEAKKEREELEKQEKEEKEVEKKEDVEEKDKKEVQETISKWLKNPQYVIEPEKKALLLKYFKREDKLIKNLVDLTINKKILHIIERLLSDNEFNIYFTKAYLDKADELITKNNKEMLVALLLNLDDKAKISLLEKVLSQDKELFKKVVPSLQEKLLPVLADLVVNSRILLDEQRKFLLTDYNDFNLKSYPTKSGSIVEVELLSRNYPETNKWLSDQHTKIEKSSISACQAATIKVDRKLIDKLINEDQSLQEIYSKTKAINQKQVDSVIVRFVKDFNNKDLKELDTDKLKTNLNRVLNGLLEDQTNDLKKQLERGPKLYREGKIDEAKELFEKLADQDVDLDIKADAFYHLGLAFKFQNNNKSAIPWFLKGANQDYNANTKATSQSALGFIFDEEGNVDEAIEWSSKAAAQENDLQAKVTAQFQLGKIFKKKGNIDAAMEWYEKAATQNDNLEVKASAQYNLGLIFKNQGNDKKAIEWLEKAANQNNEVKIKSDAMDRLRELGVNIQTYNGTIETNAKQLYNLGVKYYQEGDKKSAKPLIKQAIRYNDDLQIKANAQYYFGCILEEEGKIQKALEWYKAAANQNYDFTVKSQAKEKIEKLEYLISQADLAKKFQKARYDLAEERYNEGNKEEAIKLFTEVANQKYNLEAKSAAQFKLGSILEKDNPGEATNWLCKAATQNDLLEAKNDAKQALEILFKKERNKKEKKCGLEITNQNEDLKVTDRATIDHSAAQEQEIEALYKVVNETDNLEVKAEAQFRLGGLFFQKNNKEKTKEWLEKAAEQNENLEVKAHAQFNLGSLLYSENKKEEAKKMFLKAANQNYNLGAKAAAQQNLGSILDEEGKKEEAKKLFLEAENQNYNLEVKAAAQLNLGSAFEEEGEEKAAEEWYLKAANQSDNLEIKASAKQSLINIKNKSK